MRKTALLLAFMFVLGIPITGNAAAQYEASPFSLLIRPSISFDGTEAKCAATVIGESESDEINIVLKLWQAGTCIATWSASDFGSLQIIGYKNVTKGQPYTLSVDVSINGISKPTVCVDGDCP